MALVPSAFVAMVLILDICVLMVVRNKRLPFHEGHCCIPDLDIVSSRTASSGSLDNQSNHALL